MIEIVVVCTLIIVFLFIVMYKSNVKKEDEQINCIIKMFDNYTPSNKIDKYIIENGVCKHTSSTIDNKLIAKEINDLISETNKIGENSIKQFEEFNKLSHELLKKGLESMDLTKNEFLQLYDKLLENRKEYHYESLPDDKKDGFYISIRKFD